MKRIIDLAPGDWIICVTHDGHIGATKVLSCTRKFVGYAPLGGLYEFSGETLRHGRTCSKHEESIFRKRVNEYAYTVTDCGNTMFIYNKDDSKRDIVGICASLNVDARRVDFLIDALNADARPSMPNTHISVDFGD